MSIKYPGSKGFLNSCLDISKKYTCDNAVGENNA